MMYAYDGETKEEKFVYRNKRRIGETKRLKYQRLKENHMRKTKIKELEEELNKTNSRSCIYKTFAKYIKIKNEVNESVYEKYNEEYYRRYKWYAHINKSRHEDNLLNEIEKRFGKDCILIFGDWGRGKQLRNFISTPMIGLKRKLGERFKIYNVDEHKTTCINNVTEEKCKNLYLPDKKGTSRKLHSVLTYKMENNRYGCIQRDINSVKNMKKIVNHWLEHKKRPKVYSRKKGVNP